MRALAIIMSLVLVITFAGGYFAIGQSPLFEKIDDATGSTYLMDVHHGIFYFLYDNKDSKKAPDSTIKQFQETPLGFDKEKKYRQLDEAAK